MASTRGRLHRCFYVGTDLAILPYDQHRACDRPMRTVRKSHSYQRFYGCRRASAEPLQQPFAFPPVCANRVSDHRQLNMMTERLILSYSPPQLPLPIAIADSSLLHLPIESATTIGNSHLPGSGELERAHEPSPCARMMPHCAVDYRGWTDRPWTSPSSGLIPSHVRLGATFPLSPSVPPFVLRLFHRQLALSSP